jgi:hypothetical protein
VQTAQDHSIPVCDDGKHGAVADIAPRQMDNGIALARSMNFRQEGDEIHKRHNTWVSRFQHRLDRHRLARSGSEAG